MKINTVMQGTDFATQRSMQRWFWRTVLLMNVLVIALVLASLYQHVTYRSLSQELAVQSGTAQLHTCLENKRQLKERYDRAQERLAKLRRIRDNPKNPHKILQALQTLAHIDLQTVVLKKNKLELKIQAQDLSSVLAYTDQLRATQLISSADILSIDQASGHVSAAIACVVS